MATDVRENQRGLAEEDIKLLSLVDMLEPLSREELAGLNWKHLDTHVEQGETFYTPMDLCEQLFILKKGRVRVYKVAPDGREFTLAVLEGGTVFGEMTLTAQRLRNAYAKAMEPSEVTTMCRADVERLILDKPKVGLQLVHLLGERLYNYEVRMEYLGLREVPARLANLILLLIESEGVRTRTHFKIPTRYTHQQLGTMIGANREAVTRAFNRLREVGAVEVRRRYIHVEDMEEAKTSSDGKLFWYAVQNLLVAIGRISRLLWLPEEEAAEQRATLRESLDDEDDSPLNALEFVEHFKHFDKRLQEWYESSENLRYFDSYTEPLDVLAETTPGDRFRGYHTEKNALLFHDDISARPGHRGHRRAPPESGSGGPKATPGWWLKVTYALSSSVLCTFPSLNSKSLIDKRV